MKVRLFCQTYNEAQVLPFMIDHYKTRFRDIDIFIYDKDSTDATAKVATILGCKVIHQDGDEIRDDQLQWFKNNIWRQYPQGWTIVCDADEFLDISDGYFMSVGEDNVTVIRSKGYDMIGDTMNLDKITDGIPNPMYNKMLMFNSRLVSPEYHVGAHLVNIRGTVKQSPYPVNLYHMRYPQLQYVLDRYKMYAARLSDINKKNGWCANYMQTEEQITNHFNELWSKKIKVR